MERRARCTCGQLSVTVEGEPDFVAICNCTHCQRRTGSVFGVGAYFNRNQVQEISGGRQDFRRSSDSGRWVEQHFCPECGTTVCWSLEIWPEKLGVGAGCFTDPAFPKPVVAAWSATKYDWVEFPADCRQFEDQGG